MYEKAISRIEYIDIAKTLGIILVIAGHVVSSDTGYKTVIYAFHMPLFFMLSGMLLKVRNTYNRNAWQLLIKKKLKSLMIPYFAWALIYAAFSIKNSLLVMYGTRETLMMAESLSSLWFLPVMFLAFLIAEVVLWFSSKAVSSGESGAVIGMAVCFLVGFLFPHYTAYGILWGTDIAFVAAGFLLLGYLLRQKIELFPKTIHKFAIAAVCFGIFVITIRFGRSSVGYVLMANAVYGNPLAFLINAFTGSLAVIMISSLLSSFLRATGLFTWIGSRTLGIFVVHKPMVELGRTLAKSAGFSFDAPIILLCITLATLIISCVIVFFIENVIPEIVGLSNTKKRGYT